MDPTAVLVVLVSAFLHAAWNAILKREPDTEGTTLAIQVVTALMGIAVMLLDPGRGLGGVTAVAWGATAGLLEAAYFITLAAALHRMSLGAAYTLARGGALVIVWPLSAGLLGERVTPGSALGVLLLVGGLGLVSGGIRLGRDGLPWAALCALAIAGYSLAYKQSLAHGAAPTSLFALSLGLAAPVGLVNAGRHGRARLGATLRARLAPVVAASAACTLSFLMILVALQREGTGAVLTLRNTSVLFALYFSARLGDRPGARQIAGAVLVAVGAVLVGLRA